MAEYPKQSTGGAETPVTLTDETTTISGSRRLVAGVGNTLNTSTPGQVAIDVTGGSGVLQGVRRITSATQLDGDDKVILCSATSDYVVELPSLVGRDGEFFLFVAQGSGTNGMTIAPNNLAGDSVGFDGPYSYTYPDGPKLYGQDDALLLQGDESAATWNIVSWNRSAGNPAGAFGGNILNLSGASSDIPIYATTLRTGGDALLTLPLISDLNTYLPRKFYIVNVDVSEVATLKVNDTGSENFEDAGGGYYTLYGPTTAIVYSNNTSSWAVIPQNLFVGATKETSTNRVLVPRTSNIQVSFDGGGSALTTGVKGDIRIPFDCTILEATLLADQSGSIVIDIWKDTLANYPPTDADSITASAPPTIVTDTDSNDSTLTGWTTSLAEGDTLRFNIDSVTTITRVTLVLKVQRT